MNQLKIGKFIVECRREKDLTQNELAEKLGITDRAVSKWERGVSLPDASLMLDLCNILGINVNELLTGERIKSENYMKKAEENLINVSMENQKMKKQTIIKNAVAIINLIVIFIIGKLPIVNLMLKPFIYIGIAIVAVIIYLIMLWKNFKLRDTLLWLTMIVNVIAIGFIFVLAFAVPYATRMSIYRQLQETTINAMKYIAINDLEKSEELVYDIHDFTKYDYELESCKGYIVYEYNNGNPEIKPYCKCDLNWDNNHPQKDFFKLRDYDESYLSKIQRIQK